MRILGVCTPKISNWCLHPTVMLSAAKNLLPAVIGSRSRFFAALSMTTSPGDCRGQHKTRGYKKPPPGAGEAVQEEGQLWSRVRAQFARLQRGPHARGDS